MVSLHGCRSGRGALVLERSLVTRETLILLFLVKWVSQFPWARNSVKVDDPNFQSHMVVQGYGRSIAAGPLSMSAEGSGF